MMTTAVASIALAACAVQPTGPTPAPTPVAAASTAPAAGPKDDSYAEFVRYAHSSGYKLSKADGKELWCRDEAPLGSRIEKQSCISSAALAEMQRQATDMQEQLRRGGSQNCPASGCN